MADNSRVPRYELHIRPMIRLIDYEEMLERTGLNLWDYDSVVSKAKSIHGHIRADMPPIPYGGLWPQEWVDLFERWMNTGFQRLELGKAKIPYQATRSGSTIELLGATILPDESYEGWLQQEFVVETGREYTLYWLPPDTMPQPPLHPREAILEESFKDVLTLNRVVINDADGRHEVQVN